MNISPGFFVLHVRQMAGSTTNNGAVALAISDKPPIFVEDVKGTRILRAHGGRGRAPWHVCIV